MDWNSSPTKKTSFAAGPPARASIRSPCSRFVAEEVAREELEVLEVEHRLPRLRGGVLVGEAREELLEEVAVAERQLLECGLLDAAPGFLVRRRPLASRRQLAEVAQPLRVRPDLEGERGARALELGGGLVLGQAAGRHAQLLQAVGEIGPLAQLEHEVAAGGPELLVDARERPAQPVRAVGGEEPQPLGVAADAELLERPLERLAAHDRALRLVELAEARVDPDRERMRAEQAGAEAVDGRDPGAVELPGEVAPAAR